MDYIESKAWSRINLLRSQKFDLDRRSLQTMYFSFIRPVLEYADVVWNNCTDQQSEDLEKNQLEAGRIVSGTTKLVSTENLYAELGWLKLSERRKLHKLYLFYKMQNGLVPDYLADLVPHILCVMPKISYKFMHHHDHILNRFFRQQFGHGIVFRVILEQPRL